LDINGAGGQNPANALRDTVAALCYPVGIHAYSWLRYQLDWCWLNKLDFNAECMNIFHFHNIPLRRLISQSKIWKITNKDFAVFDGMDSHLREAQQGIGTISES